MIHKIDQAAIAVKDPIRQAARDLFVPIRRLDVLGFRGHADFRLAMSSRTTGTSATGTSIVVRAGLASISAASSFAVCES